MTSTSRRALAVSLSLGDPRLIQTTTVEFGADLWDLLEREAEWEGVTIAQFVHDAGLFRVSLLMARRGFDSDVEATLERIASDAAKHRRR